MVKLWLCFLIMVHSAAFAGSESPMKRPFRVYQVSDSKLGELQVRIEDVGEPVQLPYQMTVTVQCLDNRSHPNAVKPKLEIAIDKNKICDFRAFNFDDKSKVLTIQYSNSSFKMEGPSECDSNWSRAIDLTAFCAEWKY